MIRTGTSKSGSFVSRTALGLALAVGVVAGGMVAATPVEAAKKKAKQGGFSKEFVAIAAPLQEEVNALETQRKAGGDVSAQAAALRPKVEAAAAAAANGQDKAAAGQFMLTVGQALQDFQLNQRALSMMVNSGAIPEAGLPQLQFFLGNFAYANKDYATAATALTAAQNAGFKHEALLPMLIQSYADSGNAAQGLAIAKQAVQSYKAAGQKVPQDAINRASLVAYKTNSGPIAMEYATLLATEYPSPTNWLNAAQMARKFSQFDPQASLDLYRLMDRSGALNTERKFALSEYKEYVETADPRRLPGEVIRIIDKGMANGVILSADRWASEYKQTANSRASSDKASIRGEVASAMKSSDGKTAQALGDAFLNYGDAAQAEELYAAALAKTGSEKNTALTRLGIAQFDQGKLAEASATFAKVSGPRKSIADLFIAYIGQKSGSGQVASGV